MVKKCNIVNCNGNYNAQNKCRVFKLPRDEAERQTWTNVIPSRSNYEIDPKTFIICERHWNAGYPTVKIPGGSTRPSIPPSVFNVPRSCLPTEKPPPRPPRNDIEDRQVAHQNRKDRLKKLSTFSPDKSLKKKYSKDYFLIFSRTNEQFVCLFMSLDLTECQLSVIVKTAKSLTSELAMTIHKCGIRVPLGSILNPNNGLNSYSMFDEAVRIAVNFQPSCGEIMKKAAKLLKDHTFNAVDCCRDNKNSKRISFLTHQLELAADKRFSMDDYCFAIESFPNAHYEQLRDVLILPSKRKLQSVIASVNLDTVLDKTFQSLSVPQQKNVFLLVDEVKIRPTISFSGGVLSGMAKNHTDCRATSMLCVMMKCLHKGPSVMLSVTPVHKLTAAYQHGIVIEAATQVERAGGKVLGSITDNHKINQQFCTLFTQIQGNSSAIVQHPLDPQRVWFLLFDTVHILKCLRNNWITEKTKQISLDQTTIASFKILSIYTKKKRLVF